MGGAYGHGVLQLREGRREALLDLGHPAVGGQQLLLQRRDVTHLRHLLQDRAEAPQAGPDPRRVVQNPLRHQETPLKGDGTWSERPLVARDGTAPTAFKIKKTSMLARLSAIKTRTSDPRVRPEPQGRWRGLRDPPAARARARPGTWRWCRRRAPPARTGPRTSSCGSCRPSPGAPGATGPPGPRHNVTARSPSACTAKGTAPSPSR